jgi:hypothetical protein
MRQLRVGLLSLAVALVGVPALFEAAGGAEAVPAVTHAFSYYEHHPCQIVTVSEVAKASQLPVSKSFTESNGGSNLEGPACDYTGPPDDIVSLWFGHESASDLSILYTKPTSEPSLGSGGFCAVNKGSILYAQTFANVAAKGGSGWSLTVREQAAHLPSCSLPVAVNKLVFARV